MGSGNRRRQKKSFQAVRLSSPVIEGKVKRLSEKVSQPNRKLQCKNCPKRGPVLARNAQALKSMSMLGELHGIPKVMQLEAVS